MTDDVDYTVLSGAEFQRAVGADPEKWAAAFYQRFSTDPVNHVEMSLLIVERWFTDAMDAARAEGQRLGRIGEGE